MSVTFRNADATEADAVAALHATSWRSAYRGILTDAFLDAAVDEDRREFWRARFAAADWDRLSIRVAEQDDALAGFACVVLDADERWGALLDNLHVLPDLKGQGIGRQLMAQAAAWVADRRPASALHLWVYEANRPARGFYD